MRVKKITTSQALPDTKVVLNGTSEILLYELDESGFVEMGYENYKGCTFEYDEVTITEKPKKYKDSGAMVRFTIPNLDGEYLMFWSDFKSIIDVSLKQRDVNIDLVVNGSKSKYNQPKKVVKKPKGPKLWTEKQKNRLADPGYYIEYYGEPTDFPTMYGVIALGLGTSKYINTPQNKMEWSTLSWVSSVTKKKLERSKKNLSDKEYRYIYFKDFDSLSQWEGFGVLSSQLIPAPILLELETEQV